MSHKETTRVALALKYIDEERLAPTHRRGDGGDDENKEPKRRVKRIARKAFRRKRTTTTTISDLRSGGTHNDARGSRATIRAGHASQAAMVSDAARGVGSSTR